MSRGRHHLPKPNRTAQLGALLAAVIGTAQKTATPPPAEPKPAPPSGGAQ
jgi:hypothetical protein